MLKSVMAFLPLETLGAKISHNFLPLGTLGAKTSLKFLPLGTLGAKIRLKWTHQGIVDVAHDESFASNNPRHKENQTKSANHDPTRLGKWTS
jgi:hypothetical protein